MPPNTIAGQIIGGHYHVEQPLSSGNFGQTYLARDTHLPDRPYRIVKKLQPQFTDPSVCKAAQVWFEREAQVLYQLGEHPQIPKLFAHFSENQEFYLVQEYIEGHDLTEEIYPPNGGNLNEAEVIQLLQEILEVLAVVHQQDIIHRDIKPPNIRRRTRDGKLVLIDFGAVKEIATQANNGQRNNAKNSKTLPIGTPGYMPDEQEKGHPKLSSDIYAVGMLAIQALTGVSPDRFPRDPNSLEIIWQNQGSVSPELAAILNKMVAYNFLARYQNATQALTALTSIINVPLTVPVTIPSPAPVSQSLVKFGVVKMGLSICGTIIIGLSLGLFLAYSLSHVVQPSPETTQEKQIRQF
jgi:serine/threonine protein kinase